MNAPPSAFFFPLSMPPTGRVDAASPIAAAAAVKE